MQPRKAKTRRKAMNPISKNMELKILGSSSSGNCYLFDNGKEALMVECGVPFNKVKKAVDFDLSRIVCCLVSHEHGDHARSARQVLASRIPLYMSRGTAQALQLPDNTQVRRIEAGCIRQIGGFRVIPFNVKHDAAEPLGYLIKHPEMGTTLFATDTYYLEHKFAGMNNILIECNYDIKILDANIAAGLVSAALRKRTVKSHMNIETCLEALGANDLTEVNNIVLNHLSASNSNAKEFQRRVEKATGKNVIVARKDMTIEFNKTPF